MSLNCNSKCVWKNPLLRDGTSQSDRFLQALNPDFAKIDERDTEEFLRFAFDYATRFKFYKLDNTDSGQDWQGFFKNDAVATALVLREDIAGARRSFAAAKHSVLTATNPNRKSRFDTLLKENDKVFALLDYWLELTKFGEVFRKDLERVIRSQIGEMLKIHRAYYLGAEAEITLSTLGPLTDHAAEFPTLWAVASAPPDTFGLGSVTADTSIYVGTTQKEKIEYALNYVEAVFDGLMAGLDRVRTAARIALDMFLERWPDHQPHFALFLTFIQLFRFAQDHLNTLTKRHLDLFYRDILLLNEKKAIPDQVHIIFELASNLTQHLVPTDTGLDAKKDAIGKNLVYRTNNEIVVNQAEVSSLKTVFLGRYKTGPSFAEDFGVVIFDAPVADSIDGLGAPLSKEEPRWKPFGEVQKAIDVDEDGIVDHTSMRLSRYGFAFSSPIMIMKEGIRELTVSLTVDGAKASLADYWSNGFEFRITGETGWLEPEAIIATPVNTSLDPMTALVTLRFGRSQEAVVRWNEEIHGRTYGSPWPVLEITLNHLYMPSATSPNTIPYEDLEAITIMQAQFSVNVRGITDLVLQNDQGRLDPAKPFPPFTQVPNRNANFYIGNWEVFSKKLDTLTVDIGWLDVPASNLSEYYEGYGTWNRTNAQGKTYSDYQFTPIIPKTKNKRVGSGTVNNINGDFKGRLKLLNDYSWKNLIKGTSVMSCQYEISEHKVVIAPGIDNRIKVTNSGNAELPATAPESGIKNTTNDEQDLEYLMVQAANAPTSYPASSSVNHYATYSAPVCTGNWATGNNFFLFDETDANRPIRIKAFKESGSSHTPATLDTSDTKVTAFKDIYDYCGFDNLPANTYFRDPNMPEIGPYTANTRRGFLKIELASDMLHSIYPQVITQSTLVTSKIVTDGTHTGDLQPAPNPPFTPKIKDISLSYESTVKVNYVKNVPSGQYDEEFITYDTRFERMYHVLPFGEKEVFPATSEKDVPATVDTTFNLFPGFGVEFEVIDTVKKFIDKGFLYIGLKNLNPAQELSLLFQFAEGTEDPSIAIPEVKWAFLSNNQWKLFQPLQIVRDTTNGMANSGIVTLSVPSGATNNNTCLPKGLHWLRVEAPSGVTAFSDLIAVHAQAVAASFTDQSNDPNHLKTPLPGEVIKKFLQGIGSIKKLKQPYPSFGGRVKEEGNEFYLRVSETLRHKHRAITIWDYEHQVLEEFPDIYKVKCINHTDDDSELAPGAVKVVLIPKVGNFLAVKNPFELKVGTRTLAAVDRYLSDFRNPFVDLKVQNPVYEKVKASFKVQFHVGRDVNFYKKKLNADIQRFLSPWAYGEIETIRFGGTVHKSLVINFIEELEYVDYLIDFQLKHFAACDTDYKVVEAAVASTAASILVTAETHDIEEA